MSSRRVELENVAVRYGRVVALRDVTLAVRAGQLLCVRGVNGAGKTTLLRLLAGVLRPSSGTRIGPGRIAYVPPGLTPPSLSAKSWLRGVRSRHHGDPFAALERLGFEGELGRSCRELSFGNLRKVLLADALSNSADLIVIDEANIGLDTTGHQGMTELVNENLARGSAVVAAVQQSETLAGADSIVVVSDHTIRARDVGEADIGFRGPPEHIDTLIRAAQELGFYPTSDQS